MLPEVAPPTLAQLRARIARAVHAGDTDEITAARAEYATAKLEKYVTEVVAEAPPLSAEQRDRIALRLAPVLAAGGGGRG